MPGFAVTNQQAGNQRNPPSPSRVIYSYTWDITNLVGKGIQRNNPLVYLKSANLPQLEFEEENYDTGHVNYRFPKGVKWSDVKLSFYDTEGLKDQIISFYRSIWTPNTGLAPASVFMNDTKIQVYFNNDQVAYSWVLRNSWVKQLSYSELTYEASNVLNVNLVIGYHWAEQQ